MGSGAIGARVAAPQPTEREREQASVLLFRWALGGKGGNTFGSA